jgi:hypothetical protein
MKRTVNPKQTKIAVAPYVRFFLPFIQALKKLGGSGTRKEVCQEIIASMNISKRSKKKH